MALGFNPSELCHAYAIFLQKPNKENYTTAKAFRGISLYSFMLKGLERVNLYYVLNVARPLHKYSYAYQKGKSCDLALSQSCDKIESGTNRLYAYTLGMSFDLKGAFDNVTTTAIQNGLRRLEVPEPIIQWFIHLLDNRLTTGLLQEHKATYKITRGTAQGSVFSPYAFNAAVDEILEQLNNGTDIQVTSFSDDFEILISGTSLETIINKGQNIVNDLVYLLDQRGLEINAEKSNLVIFTNTPYLNPRKITINGVTKEYSKGYKRLGKFFDEKLNFREDVKMTVARAKKRLFAAKCIYGKAFGPSPWLSRQAWLGQGRESISYGSHLWAHKIPKDSFIANELKKIQRTALLNIAQVLRSTSTRSLEVIYHVPPSELYIQSRSLITTLRIKSKIDRTWNDIGYPTGHLKYNLDFLTRLNMENLELDKIPKEFSWVNNFKIDIPSKMNYAEIQEENRIYVYTDGSRRRVNQDHNKHAGSGVFIREMNKPAIKRSYYLGTHASSFQAEITAILCSTFLLNTTNKTIIIRSDCISAIIALASTDINSHIVKRCKDRLNLIGLNNDITLQWIKAHDKSTADQTDGNEKADELAKAGCENHDPANYIRIRMPYSMAKSIIYESTLYPTWERMWQEHPTTFCKFPCAATKYWLPNISKRLSNRLIYNKPSKKYTTKPVTREDLGRQVQFITNHNLLRRHRRYLEPSITQQNGLTACRLCGDNIEMESAWHLATKCPLILVEDHTEMPHDPRTKTICWTAAKLRRLINNTCIIDLMKYESLDTVAPRANTQNDDSDREEDA